MLSNYCKFASKMSGTRAKNREYDMKTYSDVYYLFQDLLPHFQNNFNIDNDTIKTFTFEDAHYFCDIIASYSFHKIPTKVNWTV